LATSRVMYLKLIILKIFLEFLDIVRIFLIIWKKSKRI